jgi:hypothetical protein
MNFRSLNLTVKAATKSPKPIAISAIGIIKRGINKRFHEGTIRSVVAKKYRYITKNNNICTVNLRRFEKTIDIGTTNLGKYTLAKMYLYEINVSEDFIKTS